MDSPPPTQAPAPQIDPAGADAGTLIDLGDGEQPPPPSTDPPPPFGTDVTA